jgi:hypothetical protein
VRPFTGRALFLVYLRGVKLFHVKQFKEGLILAVPSRGRGLAIRPLELLDLSLPHPRNLTTRCAVAKSHGLGGGHAMARRPSALIPRLNGFLQNGKFGTQMQN